MSKFGLQFLHLEKKKSELFQYEGQEKMKKKYKKAEDFDKAFDVDQDVIQFLDLSKIEKPAQRQKRVNVDFPIWMIQALEREARKLGGTKQSVIKFWIAEKLKQGAA